MVLVLVRTRILILSCWCLEILTFENVIIPCFGFLEIWKYSNFFMNDFRIFFKWKISSYLILFLRIISKPYSYSLIAKPFVAYIILPAKTLKIGLKAFSRSMFMVIYNFSHYLWNQLNSPSMFGKWKSTLNSLLFF